jgi:hypothetical protein
MYFVTKQKFQNTTHWHPFFAWLPRVVDVYEVHDKDPYKLSNRYVPTATTRRTGKRAFVWLDTYHAYCYGELDLADSHIWNTVKGFLIHPTRMRE